MDHESAINIKTNNNAAPPLIYLNNNVMDT